MSIIKDINLAPSGEMKINWVERNMPVLRGIGRRFPRRSLLRDSRSRFPSTLRLRLHTWCRGDGNGRRGNVCHRLKPSFHSG